MTRLPGTRTLVVGGARGIGAAIAARVVEDGGRVVILDRLGEEGTRTAALLDAPFVDVDVTDAAAVDEAIARSAELLGGIDALVNCVGVLRRGPLLGVTADEWDLVFAVNTRSMLLTMQRSHPYLVAAGGGAVVNIASMAAKSGGADEGAYPASKAAVVALTRTAALEWGCDGITVNSVCPGYVLTEMGADTRTEADIAAWSSRSPLGRLGETSDVAGVVSFLICPDARYLTGQALNVTGGMIMH